MKATWLSLSCALCLWTSSAIGQPERVNMTVVKPGGGILVADGSSRIPLMIVMSTDGPSVKNARIFAGRGETEGTQIVTPHRVLFYYKAPKSTREVDEILDVTLTLTDGNTIAEAFTLSVPPPSTPTIRLEFSPDQISVSDTSPIEVNASAQGSELQGLIIVTGETDAEHGPLLGTPTQLERSVTVQLPNLPADAPSLIGALAVTAGTTGYAAVASGVPVTAPVRLSVEIAPGAELVVRGVDDPPPPVVALKDGKTVVENVMVRYGQQLEAFEVSGSREKRLSIIVPTGFVAQGLVAAIPDQAVADGGRGPSLVLAVPPAPFGGVPFWPDITVVGATLIRTVDITETVKALVLDRPLEPTNVEVRLDDIPVAEIAFGAGRPQSVELAPTVPGGDERGAVMIILEDASHKLTDMTPPKVRMLGGGDLEVRRESVGRYRAVIPRTTPGSPGESVEIIVEVSPPPRVAGSAQEYLQAGTKVKLTGPPPAVKGQQKTTVVTEPEEPAPLDLSPGFRLGLGGGATLGSSFGPLLFVGGQIHGELRLPMWNQRLGARLGMEFSYASGSGRVRFEGRSPEAKTSVGGFVFPVEVLASVVDTNSFDLIVRAGAEIRVEQGTLRIMDDNAGGGSRTGLAGRVGADGQLQVGSGVLFLGVGVGGLGSNLSGFSNDQVQIRGSMFHLRADMGYRYYLEL